MATKSSYTDGRHGGGRRARTLLDAPQKIREQYDAEKTGIPIDQVPYYYKTRVWWKCIERQHSFEGRPSTRIDKMSGCPCCANKLVAHDNNLAYCFPEVAQWLDTEKSNFTALGVIATSEKDAWWTCYKNHSYPMKISHKTRDKLGCPFCSGRYPTKENNLLVCRPDLAAEFDDKRNGITPDKITPKTPKQYWWKCGAGHSFRASPNDRSRADYPVGCNQCSRRKPSLEYNLQIAAPDLAFELNTEKSGFSATQCTPKIGWTAIWNCQQEHEYPAKVRDRFIRGAGCPFCSGRYATPENNLLVKYPSIAAELDIDKSGFRPEECTPAAPRKAIWNCSNGHQYPTLVSSRTRKGRPSGCPQCCTKQTSRIETALRKECGKSSVFENVSPEAHNIVHVPWRKRKTMSVDIIAFYDGMPVVIEYDGWYFHSGRRGKGVEYAISTDTDKTQALLNAGYKVVRVREKKDKNILFHLDICHSNLLQITYDYSLLEDDLQLLVRNIEEWVVEK